MRSLNFLLVPFVCNNYDLNQLQDIKEELIKNGHSATIINRIITEDKLSELVNEGNYNCVFRVNGPRPFKIKKDVRFITWYQDFYFDSIKQLESFKSSDIVYFYTAPEAYGIQKKLNCLTSNFYPGINDINNGEDLQSISKITSINKYQNVDLSLLGVMISLNICNFNNFHYRNYKNFENHQVANMDYSYFLNELDKDEKKLTINEYKEFVCELQNIVELNYKPLSGELKIFKLVKKIRKTIKKIFRNPNQQIFKEWQRFFSTEYPRFLDRLNMARLMSRFSSNFIVVGDGWERLNEFLDFYRKKIEDKDNLYELFKRSKINLYTNTHGGGMHNKIFEIMINGGFVALPISSRNNMLGGIEECFIDGEHFSSFNPHKFDEFIDNWLNNSEKRLLIGSNARKEVLDKHTWRSRIYKLLNDLSH